jgi:hypothetical protein
MRNLYSRCLAGVGIALISTVGSVAAQSVRPIGPPGGDVQALAAVQGGTRILYFGTPDGHIFSSGDSGVQWSQLGRIGTGHDEVVTSIVIDPRNTKTLMPVPGRCMGVAGAFSAAAMEGTIGALWLARIRGACAFSGAIQPGCADCGSSGRCISLTRCRQELGPDLSRET